MTISERLGAQTTITVAHKGPEGEKITLRAVNQYHSGLKGPGGGEIILRALYITLEGKINRVPIHFWGT